MSTVPTTLLYRRVLRRGVKAPLSPSRCDWTVDEREGCEGGTEEVSE